MSFPSLDIPYFVDRADFVKGYNENLQDMAEQVWNQLDNTALVLFLVMFVIPALFCIGYYGPFNNENSGRHYRLRWMVVFGAAASVLVGVITFMRCNSYFDNLDDVNGVRMQISLINSVLAIISYIVSSLVACLFFPTNAYRWTKRVI